MAAYRIRNFLVLALIALGWTGTGLARPHADEPAPKSWTPTTALVAEVESQLRMPKDKVLGDYARYYYGEYEGGHRQLVGTFVRKGMFQQTAGVKIVPGEEDVPRIYDGGCLIVHLVFDADTKQVVLLKCNGSA